MIQDIIREYEKIGYVSNGDYELFIEDSKFKFKRIYDENIFSIEYNLKENYDDREYTKEEIKDMKLCLYYVKKLGFEIDI